MDITNKRPLQHEMIDPMPKHALSPLVVREVLDISANDRCMRISDVWEVGHVLFQLGKRVERSDHLLLLGSDHRLFGHRVRCTSLHVVRDIPPAC